jgi:hypothetical protein
LEFHDSKVLISSVDTQTSLNGGVIVQVLGELAVRGGSPSQKFVQTFFLAEQPNGYYVLNDIFRYLKEDIEEHYAEDLEESAPTKETPEVNEVHHAPEPASAPEPKVEEKQPEKVIKEPVKESPKKPAQPVEQQRTASPSRPQVTEQPRKEAWKTPAPVVAQPIIQEAKPAEQPAEVKPQAEPAAPVQKTWANMAANNRDKWGKQVADSKGQVTAVNAPAKVAAPQQPAIVDAQPSASHPTQAPQQSQQGQQQSQGPPQGHYRNKYPNSPRYGQDETFTPRT